MFENINLIAIFIAGLTGGISCIAVQGGLLATTLASRSTSIDGKSSKKQELIPVFSFITAKLVAYTILGGLLGWLGSLFIINLQVQIFLQFAVVLFMVGTALNLLNVHPIFRYFIIQPPRFLSRLVRKQSKQTNVFAPALLGAFTVFIPCGVTQAMMLLAISSGSVLAGALIMSAFILGTSPVFFLIGYFTLRLGDILKKRFIKIAAIIIILLSLYNLNNALALTGTRYTISNLLLKGFCFISYCSDETIGQIPVREQDIMITPTGYSPSFFTVNAGSEVPINLANSDATGCQQAFVIPALNIQKIVLPGQADSFTFRAPNNPGEISFMCSAGLYVGTIRVI